MSHPPFPHVHSHHTLRQRRRHPSSADHHWRFDSQSASLPSFPTYSLHPSHLFDCCLMDSSTHAPPLHLTGSFKPFVSSPNILILSSRRFLVAQPIPACISLPSLTSRTSYTGRRAKKKPHTPTPPSRASLRNAPSCLHSARHTFAAKTRGLLS
jgi:hypothetical protein